MKIRTQRFSKERQTKCGLLCVPTGVNGPSAFRQVRPHPLWGSWVRSIRRSQQRSRPKSILSTTKCAAKLFRWLRKRWLTKCAFRSKKCYKKNNFPNFCHRKVRSRKVFRTKNAAPKFTECKPKTANRRRVPTKKGKTDTTKTQIVRISKNICSPKFSGAQRPKWGKMPKVSQIYRSWSCTPKSANATKQKTEMRFRNGEWPKRTFELNTLRELKKMKETREMRGI